MAGGWVYILANRYRGTIYTGVTADLGHRIAQHRAGTGSKFAAEYGCRILVWAEPHDAIEDAILREKRIKKWNRDWKIRLIEAGNRDWVDLNEMIVQ